MFAVEHHGHTVFFFQDPRNDGYRGEVNEGVTLNQTSDDPTVWPDGAERPNNVLGKRNDVYTLCVSEAEFRASGLDRCLPYAGVFHNWKQYKDEVLDDREEGTTPQ